MRPSSNAVRAFALAAGLAALAGCSEYTDRRDLISIQGGNAVQTNKITQMVDPWSRASAQRDIAFNGDVMESAYQRYRTGRVTPPSGTGTSTTYKPAQSGTTSGAAPGQSTK
ncbi:MAG: hypothetical protein ACK4UO_13295 [Pseudolabrys sp.]